MSIPKIIISIFVFLVALIIVVSFPKKENESSKNALPAAATMEPMQNVAHEIPKSPRPNQLTPISSDVDLPKDVNCIAKLFQPYPPILPFVKTVSYTARVPWLTGRPAYLGDYAAHFQTSKHFIARSLHGQKDYFTETVCLADRFNVLKEDMPIEFHLVLDLSRLKLWLYAYEGENDIRYLLNTYPVCAGRINQDRSSGSLTPTGVFSIGKDIAVYKEGTVSNWKDKPTEMITVFGVRWISLGKEIADCTGSCRGLGLHGVPWKRNDAEELVEYRECIGNYESGGCIRLLTEDIEELYAIVTSRPAFVHIVNDYTLAEIPGKNSEEALLHK